MVSSKTPIPKFQVALVYLIQFTEPLAASLILPFIKLFIDSTGITKGNEKKNGYFTGIVESAFFLAESLTVMMWAVASDKFGRRMVLILGPLGLAIATLCFGLSTKYFELILFRSIQGIFNGNIGVSKTVLAELSDSSNMAQIFSFTGPIWTIGVILGPSIGGALANPESVFPSHLGKLPLLRAHPYFLPCAAVAFIAFSIFLLAFFGLKETHQVHRKKSRSFKPSFGFLKKKASQNDLATEPCLPSTNANPNYGTIRSPSIASSISDSPTLDLDAHDLESDQETAYAHSDSGDNDDDDDEQVEPPAPFKAILISDVLLPITNYAFVTFLDASYVVLAPLAYTTSVASGGMGLTPLHVGFILFCGGLINIPFPIFIPKLISRFGPRKVYLTGLSSFFWGFGGLWVLSWATERTGYATGAIRVLLPIHYMVYYLLVGLSYSTADLFVISGVPSKSVLGAANGLCQTVKTVARTFGPVCATSMFSLSKGHNLLGGQLVYFLLLLIASVALRTGWSMPRELRKF